jgi:hypothetical protein
MSFYKDLAPTEQVVRSAGSGDAVHIFQEGPDCLDPLDPRCATPSGKGFGAME